MDKKHKQIYEKIELIEHKIDMLVDILSLAFPNQMFLNLLGKMPPNTSPKVYSTKKLRLSNI